VWIETRTWRITLHSQWSPTLLEKAVGVEASLTRVEARKDILGGLRRGCF
jgi:hypothetical protein